MLNRRFFIRILTTALILNFLIFGAYAILGLFDYIRHEAYQNLGFFLIWVISLSLVAILSLMGLLKIRLAGILSSFAGMVFYLWMTHGFIDWYFDPFEQGRNGGVLYIALICFGLAALNFVALIGLLKNSRALER